MFFFVIEFLKIIFDWVLLYWICEIVLKVVVGENIIVVVYGNSLWVLCKYLLDIFDDEIMFLEILIGNFLFFDFDIDFKVKLCCYLDEGCVVDLLI